jgi:hypothetical protein
MLTPIAHPRAGPYSIKRHDAKAPGSTHEHDAVVVRRQSPTLSHQRHSIILTPAAHRSAFIPRLRPGGVPRFAVRAFSAGGRMFPGRIYAIAHAITTGFS